MTTSTHSHKAWTDKGGHVTGNHVSVDDFVEPATPECRFCLKAAGQSDQ